MFKILNPFRRKIAEPARIPTPHELAKAMSDEEVHSFIIGVTADEAQSAQLRGGMSERKAVETILSHRAAQN